MSCEEEKQKITVSGVTFSADQVKSAIITVDGRDIKIEEKKTDSKIGFKKDG